MALQTQESVYNLIPREAPVVVKEKRHSSKFGSTTKDECQAERHPHKTMGPAKVPAPRTDLFLKKNQYDPVYGVKTGGDSSFKYPDENKRKPPVPRADDQPLMGMRTTKNFINVNAVENIMSVPRKPEQNYVDTKKGDKQPLETSGLYPKYSNKKDYGKCPSYLLKRQEEMEARQHEYDQYIAERFRQGAMMKLSDEERQNILNGLKTNWEELHHTYQGLSVVTDTAPKKYKKERIESEMKQLERDIELVEKHGIIYIAN